MALLLIRHRAPSAHLGAAYSYNARVEETSGSHVAYHVASSSRAPVATIENKGKSVAT